MGYTRDGALATEFLVDFHLHLFQLLKHLVIFPRTSECGILFCLVLKEHERENHHFGWGFLAIAGVPCAAGDAETFKRRRETEIKHGRVAMYATMGCSVLFFLCATAGT